MEQIVEKWDQDNFNRWVADHDDTLTYNEVMEEAAAHDLDGERAILFARVFADA